MPCIRRKDEKALKNWISAAEYMDEEHTSRLVLPKLRTTLSQR
jgi:hypothetical protein